jgi:hypothetical protein
MRISNILLYGFVVAHSGLADHPDHHHRADVVFRRPLPDLPAAILVAALV